MLKRDAPSFSVSIRVLDDRPYKYGRLTNVECLVTDGEDEYEMSWTRRGARSRGHVTHKSHNKIMLEIRSIIPMEFGEYVCAARRRSDGVTAANAITFRRDADAASGFEFGVERASATVKPAASIVRPQRPGDAGVVDRDG